jgi:hypothetical protein
MRYLSLLFLVSIIVLQSCSPKKTAQTETTISDSATVAATAKPLMPEDSIEQAVVAYDPRLDIKMRRKTYEPKPGTLVTLQQWWEFGDSARVIKLREEILTGATRMQILQYHFVNGKLAEIHTNDDNRLCDGQPKQCIEETKYFVRNGAMLSASRRQATEGSDKSLPNIEATPFGKFDPAKTQLPDFLARMKAINAKWATLPYPKRRPEQGSSVPPAQRQ